MSKPIHHQYQLLQDIQQGADQQQRESLSIYMLLRHLGLHIIHQYALHQHYMLLLHFLYRDYDE